MFLPRRRPTAAEDPTVTVVPAGRPGPVHWTLVLAGLVLAGWLYVCLAGILVSTTNQNPLAQDQKNNMRLALEAREAMAFDLGDGLGPAIRRWLPHLTDGVVAPLWPWAAARVARDDHRIDPAVFAEHTPADLALFERGKWLNVWITGLFLAGLALWVARRWTVLGTLNFVGLAMLGALLPRAVTFQPEPLYFIFFFLCWMMGLALCSRNPLGWYAVLGLLCGLAGLAKSSIQPLMAIWFGVTALRFALGLWIPSERWSPARHVIGVMMWVSIFLVVMAPRLVHAQERWGRPFFAYPNVWMWMDDFPTGYAWMGEHPDAKSLDAVPKDRWPSSATYWASHSTDQMLTRLQDGLLGEDGSVRTFLAPKGSGKNAGTQEKPWKRLLEPRGGFLGGLAAVAVAAAALGWAGRRQAPSPDRPTASPANPWPDALCRTFLVVGAVVAFTCLYAWYVPVGRGERFMLSLWLPLVFSLTAWAEAAIRPLGWGPGRWTYTGLQTLLLGFLLWRVGEILRAPIFETKLY